MKTRLPIAIAVLVILAACTNWAYSSSQLSVTRVGFGGSFTYNLLFDSAVLALPLAAFVGVFLGTLGNGDDGDTPIVNGKVERHSELMFFQHWTHAIGTVTLIVTGLGLGTLFVPRTIQSVERIGFAMNMHFIGILFFLVGASYYVTKGLFTGEIKHMLPKAGDLKDSIGHYKAMLFGGQAPKEEKFMAIERMIFPLWIIGVTGITLTGILKIAAHVWFMPGALMGFSTFLHGVLAIYMTLLLIGHITAAALLPASWPLIRSMVTGYVNEDYVRHHHVKWYEKLQDNKSSTTNLNG